MSSSKNENMGRINGGTKISDGKIAGERGIFSQAKKKAPLLRAMLV
jgi:hypothetical protein